MVFTAGSQSREQIGCANSSFHNWPLLTRYWIAISAAILQVRNIWTYFTLIHIECVDFCYQQPCIVQIAVW
jgi:hypothetical protein